MLKIPRKTLERKLFANGYGAVIGVDEVGMGCLAGPVVVCAAAFNSEFYKKYHHKLAGLRDSKLLNSKQREKYSQILKNLRIRYAIASESPKVIDRLNIYQASRRAMRKAINVLRQVQGDKGSCIVLVDGNKEIPGLDMEQACFVKGDRRIFAIACASVLAKAYRDDLMTRMSKKYPGYGLEIHKGYGTTLHRKKIKELGMSACHRRSFRVK